MFVAGEMLAGGSGASNGKDGVDVIDTDATNCMNLPVEALEMDMPMRIRRFELRRDSGGPGAFRGGLGCVREYELLDGEITLTHRGERYFRSCVGAGGGADGALAYGAVYRADGKKEVIPSKLVTVLRKGDRLLLETPGGGGYGDPKLPRPRARCSRCAQRQGEHAGCTGCLRLQDHAEMIHASVPGLNIGTAREKRGARRF